LQQDAQPVVGALLGAECPAGGRLNGDHHKPGASPLGCRNASLTQRETPLAFVHSAADRWRDAQYLWGLLRCAGIVGGGSQDWPPIGSLSASGNRSRMRQRAGKTGASHGPFSAPGRISPRFVMVSMSEADEPALPELGYQGTFCHNPQSSDFHPFLMP
jgi:hypothetical protein